VQTEKLRHGQVVFSWRLQGVVSGLGATVGTHLPSFYASKSAKQAFFVKKIYFLAALFSDKILLFPILWSLL